jgi:uncharacterized membrane protein
VALLDCVRKAFCSDNRPVSPAAAVKQSHATKRPEIVQGCSGIAMSLPTPQPKLAEPPRPFRRAVLRGMAVVLPPLLTVVIFLWIGGTVEQYVLEPVTHGAQWFVAWCVADVKQAKDLLDDQKDRKEPIVNGIAYHRLDDGQLVPLSVYETVYRNPGPDGVPATAGGVYRAYVRLEYLGPLVTIPMFLALFILILYLLYLMGKFMAAGVGRFFIGLFERAVGRVPIVYSATKQVSGFLFDEREVRISRVVAVEYPRKGVWAIGFVTGAGMSQIEAIEGEECVSVLICTSPVPMAGFTITVRRSDAVDVDITVDQAIQFLVSCGVVVPRPRDLKVFHPPRELSAGPESSPNPEH